ncbi:MAG TPA: M3 family oligoendopeptidase [Anaerolineales bacterium]|nr:M3 family oligoendopeptidase [Anaerolineales bacterium]
MKLKSLPTDANSIPALQWTDYEPFYKELENRDLTKDNIDQWLDDWSTLAATVDEQYWRLYIDTTVDTADKEIEKRYNKYIQEIQPLAKTAEQKLKRKLIDSNLSPRGFETGLMRIKAEAELFNEKNLSLLTEEQKLAAEYNKIVGSITVMWEGKERTPSQMFSLLRESDRSIRERAWRLMEERGMQERQKINALWEKFVPLRLQIAENSGVTDYRAYIWKQKFRFDYTPDDCKSFHAAVEEVVVPAAKRLYEKRRQRLGVDSLRPWDRYVDSFANDPIKPYGSIDEFKSKSHTIFTQVDPKFGEYFQVMLDEDLLDLESRKNKAPGAYSLGLSVAHRPFIFMSNTNTFGDVLTLLHEGGHAFHEFESAHVNFFQRGETYLPAEFAEVASMGMELLASPYITKEQGGFYSEQDAARALIGHLEINIRSWPYIALVDAFQHWVYENPKEGSISSKCEEKWADLWDRFMVGIDYSDLEGFKKIYWHRQLHVHTLPFYYIEYGLALLGAVQVFGNARRDQKKAVADYRKALSLGATAPLPELFSTAGAKFAFDANTLKNAVGLMEQVMGELEEKLNE